MYYWTAISVEFAPIDGNIADEMLKSLAEELPPADTLHPEAYYKRDPILVLRDHGQRLAEFKTAVDTVLDQIDLPSTTAKEDYEGIGNPGPKIVVSQGSRDVIGQFSISTDDTEGWKHYGYPDDNSTDSIQDKGRWMIDVLEEQYGWVPELPMWTIENAKLSPSDSDNANNNGQSPASYFWRTD